GGHRRRRGAGHHRPDHHRTQHHEDSHAPPPVVHELETCDRHLPDFPPPVERPAAKARPPALCLSTHNVIVTQGARPIETRTFSNGLPWPPLAAPNAVG